MIRNAFRSRLIVVILGRQAAHGWASGLRPERTANLAKPEMFPAKRRANRPELSARFYFGMLQEKMPPALPSPLSPYAVETLCDTAGANFTALLGCAQGRARLRSWPTT